MTKDIQTLANEKQAMASNPMSSVWVSASAGSGKTKVLKDRVLRLLLSGVAPHKIICLTFTKAAAGEMANRINDTLKEWSIISDENLIKELTKLPLGAPITSEILNTARKLFAVILDSPLNIQNLHSFCQKVLKRFPLEAEVSPHFEVIDEMNAEEVLHDSIVQSLHDEDLATDVSNILSIINEDTFSELIKNITSHKNDLFKLLRLHGADIFDELHSFLDIEKEATEESIYGNFLAGCKYDNIMEEVFQNVSGKHAEVSYSFFKLYQDSTVPLDVRINTYVKIFVSASTQKAHGNYIKVFSKQEQEELFMHEVQRCLEVQDKIKRCNLCKINKSFLNFAFEVIQKYESKKESLSVLDYNDLIFKTLALLQKADINPWVMFKLDGGIDHILVDEAQDTSPELWHIIRMLTDEFFINPETEKTLFVVGDEKQSIYSFQGADLKQFQDMNVFFQNKVEGSQKPFSNVPMNVSFRSLPNILHFVDKVFENNNQGVAKDAIEHTAFKTNAPGYIEVWNHISEEKKTDIDEITYQPKLNEEDKPNSSSEIMVKKLVGKIKELLQSEEVLPATNKPISPANIMILMQSRKREFLNLLYKELKAQNIPVEGADKFKLQNELLVDDFVSLIQFLLMPDDDLSLAELLKTPLINISEEELFDLAYDRKATLWNQLKNSKHTEIVTYLTELLNSMDYIRPYEFLNRVLNTPCPNDETSGKRAFIKLIGEHVKETIDELLVSAINFEKTNVISMQTFLHELVNNAVDIKRELEKSTKVKIMTIHGSKGLESPIVFMPDIMISSNFMSKEKVFWNDEIPIWIPSKEYLSNTASDIKNNLKTLLLEEKKRLLYVALTRAENRLYLGSYGTNHITESWGEKIREVIAEIGEPIEGGFKLGTTLYEKTENKKTEEEIIYADSIGDKSFIFNNIADESIEETPKIASSLEDEIAISPFSNTDSILFKRGLIIHKLLEILPNVNDKKQACLNFLNNKKHNLKAKQIEQISQEVLAIFNEYNYLFSGNSSAEVPIVGEIDGKKYSGIVDRLCITEEEIIIVDYKSNRPPATKPEDIPESYKKQLQIYKGILSQVYPHKNIKTAILWTNTARLMFVN